MAIAMAPLIILVEESGSVMSFNEKNADCCIAATFNPNRLSVSRAVRWDDQKSAKRDNPELQFAGADPSTMSIDLFFDTYDTPNKVKQSVRMYTTKLLHLGTVEKHGTKHRPPVCQLKWGTQAVFFQGVLTQLETTFTLFMEDGTPVRATAKCSFKQWRSNMVDLQKQDLMSSDVAKVWLVKDGQTLASIAAVEYGDPRAWRIIAEANDMDDPLAVDPGRTLILPARQLAWKRGAQL